MTQAQLTIDHIVEYLGDKSDALLQHESKTISRDRLYLPGPDFVDDVFVKIGESHRTPLSPALSAMGP